MKRRFDDGGRFLSNKEVMALQNAVEAARGKSQRQPPTQRQIEKMAAERLLKSAPPPKRLRRKVTQDFNLNEAVSRAEAMIIMHAIEVHGSKRAAAKKLRVSERTLRFKFARLRRLGLMGSGIPIGLEG